MDGRGQVTLGPKPWSRTCTGAWAQEERVPAVSLGPHTPRPLPAQLPKPRRRNGRLAQKSVLGP